MNPVLIKDYTHDSRVKCAIVKASTLLASQHIQQAMYYGAGLLCMRGISLFMLPVFTHYLDPLQYGQLEVLLAFVSIASLILSLGLVEAMYRFCGLAASMAEKKQLVAQLMSVSIIFSLIFYVFLTLILPFIHVLLPGELALIDLHYLLISIVLESPIAVALAWLRLTDQAKLFFYVTVGKTIVQTLFSWWGLKSGFAVTAICQASAISSVFLATILICWHVRQVGWWGRWQQVKPLLFYGGPFVISGIAGFLLSGADRWLIAAELGTQAVAIFAIALKFSLIPSLLMQPFSLWWYARRFTLLGSPQALKKHANIAVNGLLLWFLMIALVGVVGPLLIIEMTPEIYHEAVKFLPGLLLAVAFRSVADLLNIGCFTQTDSRLQMCLNMAVSALGFTALVVLIPMFGIIGAIAACLLAAVLKMCVFYGFSQRLIWLPYPLRRLLPGVVIMVLMIVLGQSLYA